MRPPFARLLLASEHGEHDAGAEALAFALAVHCALPLRAVLPLLSNPEFEAVAPQLAARRDAEAARARAALQLEAQARGVVLELRVRRGPELYAEIVAEAREAAAELIVIRRRGRRGLLANLLIGEMVSQVVAHAPCSVLVVPRSARMWQRGVLVGVDPGAPDVGALAQAAALAAECRLPLWLVCVAEGAAAAAAAETVLADMLERARARHGEVRGEVRAGRVHQALIDAAREHAADLLVVARHGGANVARAWIGGTAQKVIGLAECPVLVHVTAAAGSRR
ncbi:MAG TPA: universal stress protein [Rubrivivax sp.]|nr:universal stress protein [Pseudomonadota bacterium]HPP83632.1 universal stress protein [Rubrivivax sp.]